MAAIKSTFAILDVKSGRAALLRRIKRGERVPVRIDGFIDYQWGSDDGTSIEFAVDVKSVTETKRKRRAA